MARSGYLRDETKQYVPKLLAAILVGRFPERYGLNVIQMPPYAYETVEVDKMTSLSVLASYAGTDVEELKDLNPELLRATTPPGRYTLRVPPGASGITNRALARIPAGQRLDFQSYVIRKTDTLAKVATRFKVSPEDLLQANNLTKSPVQGWAPDPGAAARRRAHRQPGSEAGGHEGPRARSNSLSPACRSSPRNSPPSPSSASRPRGPPVPDLGGQGLREVSAAARQPCR